ncbi:IscS subfamily cysteine desulfurase [Desertibacillus haloalkaliphilus]|uniref:IscS subfamily cysteine desulfurase n=1 Tax=Desertibacillus haloalkaliphilus TaxID=1328930 RepID=UPI001C26E400|nr:IscS subfamily cysteine desulfurase [Desertibacillus haloalkaliphilus]MBU8905484.1 IscS subfamily cysteine desulfurase [Desertibacillus haloalkaliphilus]
MIYLDHAATTPMSASALATYTTAAKNYYGNSNSLHDYGTTADQIVTASRKQISTIINGDSNGVYFTGNGSEANRLAVLSLLGAHKQKGNHLITSEIEHPSLLNTFSLLEQQGYNVTYMPVDRHGKINVSELAKAIRSTTVLVSIQHANSEIGTIQSIYEIGQLLKDKGILFHSDCVQTFGKIPLNVKEARLDSISISAHKIYGPKGIGAVYIDPAVSWKAQVPNTTHEKGFRPGTLDVPTIAAFAQAAKETDDERPEECNRLSRLKTYFLEHIDSDKIKLEGHPIDRLPHHLGLRIKGMEGQLVMLECNRYGIAISTGSACKVGQHAPSKALLAVGCSVQEANEFIRLTFGRDTTKADIDQTLTCLEKIIKDYKSKTPV